jgi:hypothetical protein
VAAIAAMIAPAWAQQRNLRSVTFYRVKPDRVGDFQADIKEYNAVFQKAGSDRYYTIWQSLTGSNEYARVDYHAKWVELDMPVAQDPKLKEYAADLQRIGTRIIQCTESSQRIVEEVLPELSLPSTNEVPAMIRTLRTRVRPDKLNEYLALVKGEILPAAKKSGLKAYTVAQSRLGAPTTEFLTVAGFSKWAELDQPFGVAKGLGEEGYQRLLAKIRPLILESEYNVYRFQRDLSYMQAPSK